VVDGVLCGVVGGAGACGEAGFAWVAGFESAGAGVGAAAAGGAGFFFAGFAVAPEAGAGPDVPEADGVAAGGATEFDVRCPGTISSAGRTVDVEYLSG
jgi:hypothetical protein